MARPTAWLLVPLLSRLVVADVLAPMMLPTQVSDATAPKVVDTTVANAVDASQASWGCIAAQHALQAACEQDQNVKVTCVAGTFIFDVVGPSKSGLQCIPDNPFFTFPDPGSSCQVDSLGFTKYKFTFSCTPEPTPLSEGVLGALVLACLLCCVCNCFMRRRRRPHIVRVQEVALRTQQV
mmetsp:Transcript_90451/g.184427  ORF Transcript_90451/g.184427 Transcript_90451/m.184427 type:complete len:180 (+) Transcript_90451:48-587(+)